MEKKVVKFDEAIVRFYYVTRDDDEDKSVDWMREARDRARFEDRIRRTGKILSSYFEKLISYRNDEKKVSMM